MTDAAAAPIFCANHPGRETSLRCNRCEKAICPECAVLTPTGYRCKECVRNQQKAFETAQWFDYPLAVAVAGGLSFLGSLLASRIGFFTILLAPGAGVLIASVVQSLLRRRRSRRLYIATAVATAAGSLPYLLIAVVFSLSALSQGGVFGLFGLLWQGLYTFTVTSTVYYRLGGITLGR